MRHPLALGMAVGLFLTGLGRGEGPGDPKVEKPLAHLIAALKGPDGYGREWAAREIGRRRAKAAPAIPALIEALRDRSFSVRRSAAYALGDIGKPAVPALGKALRYGNAVLREGAGRALQHCCRRAVPVLVAALRDKEAKVRAVAADALAGMGSFAAAAVPALVAALRDNDPAVHRNAIIALGCIGPRAKAAIPDLIAILKDPSKRLPPRTMDERVEATNALAAIGPAAQAAVPVLMAMLKEEDEELRKHTVDALSAIGPQAKVAVPALLGVLTDEKSVWIRHTAARALWRISRRKEGFDALAADLNAKDVSLRWSASVELGQLGPESVPLLLRAVKDTDAWVRLSAIVALGNLGWGNKTVAAALGTALRDPAFQIRDNALYSLREIGPVAQTACPGLLAIFKDEGRLLQFSHVSLVGDITPPRGAVPDLMKLLRSKKDSVRQAAVAALSRIGLDARAAVPTLVSALNDKSLEVRCWAIVALGNIGPAARKALAALEPARKDTDKMIALRANMAVWKIGRNTKDVLPALLHMLRAGAAQPRRDILYAIGEMGHEAKEAMTDLKKLATDEDPTLALAAFVALWRIDRARPTPLPRLLEALQDDDERTRWEAQALLGLLGPDARPAVPALIRMWQEEPPTSALSRPVGQRRDLARLLRKIDPEATLKAGIR